LLEHKNKKIRQMARMNLFPLMDKSVAIRLIDTELMISIGAVYTFLKDKIKTKDRIRELKT
jgi:hypothetical protein